MLTASGTEENLLGAIRAGAAGYLLKSEPPERIVSFLRGVANGEAALSGEVARRLLDQVRVGGRRGGGVPDHIARSLSAREVEVLLLLDDHLSTDDIAKRLFISEHTVRSHVKSLLRKLGVSSRREALEQLALRPPLAEALGGGGDEARQRLEVVAPLQDRRHTRVRRCAAPGELPKAVVGDAHVTRASSVLVRASKPAETSRSSGSNRWTAGSTSDANAVSHSSSPEPAGKGTLTVVSSFVLGPPVPGNNIPYWCRDDVQHALVAPEDGVGAVAVMDVEIDDRDACEPELRLGVSSRDGDVVQEAEAEGQVGERVVAGRPDERERVAVDGFEADADGELCRFQLVSDASVLGLEPHRAGRSRRAAPDAPVCGRVPAAHASGRDRPAHRTRTASRSGRSGCASRWDEARRGAG